jgi:hypothetical protein
VFCCKNKKFMVSKQVFILSLLGAFFFGAVPAGFFVYLQMNEEITSLHQGYSFALSAGSEGVCNQETGEKGDLVTLGRIIEWGEVMIPNISAATERFKDPDLAKDLSKEIVRLKEDGSKARALFVALSGRDYVPGAVSPTSFSNGKDGYQVDDVSTARSIFRGNIIYAQREVYSSALCSKNPEVRAIGEGYSMHAVDIAGKP